MIKHYYEFIADKIKFLFGLVSIGIKIDGNKFIYPENIVSLKEYLDTHSLDSLTQENREEIQRAYLFRWIMGMKNNTDSKLCVIFSKDGKRKNITSWKENEPSRDIKKACISDAILKKWFNNDSSILLKDLEANIISTDYTLSEIRKAILKVDKSYIGWINIIKNNLFRNLEK